MFVVVLKRQPLASSFPLIFPLLTVKICVYCSLFHTALYVAQNWTFSNWKSFMYSPRNSRINRGSPRSNYILCFGGSWGIDRCPMWPVSYRCSHQPAPSKFISVAWSWNKLSKNVWETVLIFFMFCLLYVTSSNHQARLNLIPTRQ